MSVSVLRPGKAQKTPNVPATVLISVDFYVNIWSLACRVAAAASSDTVEESLTQTGESFMNHKPTKHLPQKLSSVEVKPSCRRLFIWPKLD